MSTSPVKKVLLLVFLTIIIVGLLGFGFIKNNEVNTAQATLASTHNELVSTQADLSSSQALLTATEAELSQTKSDLATSRADLSDTQNELQTTTQTLQDKNSQLAKALADYTKTLASLDTEKVQSAELQSTLDNLQANYGALTAGYGYVLKDPTYQQVKTFMAADRTNDNPYVDDTYVCEDFSADVIVHALQQKIRCGYVSIRYSDSAHAIVAFNTTDRGLIYIEPQSDEEVNLAAGKHYWTQCVLASPGHYYLDPPYNDTIDRFNVIW